LLRLANEQDFSRILGFIESYWRNDHIFVRNPDLMAWQHIDYPGTNINFVLAESDQEIVALLGFIPFSRFDPSLDIDTVALAIWKRLDSAAPGTGLKMLNWLITKKHLASVIAIGLNEATLPIYQSLGFKTGRMSHFAIFRPGLNESSITGQNIQHSATLGDGLRLLSHENELSEHAVFSIGELLSSNQPLKSGTYYLERFQEHPWFDYQFLTLGRGTRVVLLVVIRVVTVGNSSVIRVVDIAGNLEELPLAAGALSEVVSRLGADYMDILVHGADETAMHASGFQSTQSRPDLVIPNYFEPFEPRNVEVLFAYKTPNSPLHFHLHPADSDQDRPNE